MEASEAVRRHEVRSPAGVVARVQAPALTVSALSLTGRGVERLVGGPASSSSSSSCCSAITAGLARPDPHHLPRLDHLLCNEECEVWAVRLDIKVKSLDPNLSNCCGRAGLCKD